MTWALDPDIRPQFSTLLKAFERLPKKRLIRSPSQPTYMTRSANALLIWWRHVMWSWRIVWESTSRGIMINDERHGLSIGTLSPSKALFIKVSPISLVDATNWWIAPNYFGAWVKWLPYSTMRGDYQELSIYVFYIFQRQLTSNWYHVDQNVAVFPRQTSHMELVSTIECVLNI